jgi:Mat/Ecp fimbriae major subunit
MKSYADENGQRKHAFRLIALMAAVCGLLAMTPVQAQAVSVFKLADLSFGKIARGSFSSTITISPVGQVTCGASLLCLGMSQQAAKFRITGAENNVVDIQTDAGTTLNGPGGASMDVTLNPSTYFMTLNIDPAQNQVTVGGMLTVSSSQVAGEYSGSFTLTANYN